LQNAVYVSLDPDTDTHHSMAEQQKKQHSGVGCLVWIVVGAAIAAITFIFSPGMVLTALLRQWIAASWDTGQVWAFAVTISVFIWLAMFLVKRNVRTATLAYLILCGVTGAIFAFSHFGLKSEFTADTVVLYFPQAKPDHATPTPSPRF
jgi:hypothetical protein